MYFCNVKFKPKSMKNSKTTEEVVKIIDKKNSEITTSKHAAIKNTVGLISALNRHVKESAKLCDGAMYEVTCIDMKAARIDAIMLLVTVYADGSTTVHHYDVVLVQDDEGGITCNDYYTGESQL